MSGVEVEKKEISGCSLPVVDFYREDLCIVSPNLARLYPGSTTSFSLQYPDYLFEGNYYLHLRSAYAQLGLDIERFNPKTRIVTFSNWGPHNLIVPPDTPIPIVNAYQINGGQTDIEKIRDGETNIREVSEIEKIFRIFRKTRANSFLRIARHSSSGDYCFALLTDPNSPLNFYYRKGRGKEIDLSKIGSGARREVHHPFICLGNTFLCFPDTSYLLTQTSSEIFYPPGYGMIIIGGAFGFMKNGKLFEPEVLIEHGRSNIIGGNKYAPSHTLIGELKCPPDFYDYLIRRNYSFAILAVPARLNIID